jgi:RimJ/RimL family protein N-acetyltransferase
VPAIAPTIETARLVLRSHDTRDLDPCAAMWADPRVVRYVGGQPISREAIWSKILRHAGHWAIVGYGYWALEEKATGRYVGEAGFADIHREMTPPVDVAPEIGWALEPASHGKGLATEAVAAAVAWADAQLDAPYTYAMIHPENAASLRVAAKTGYREHVRTTYKDEMEIILRRPRG